jgi:Mg2+ and Co2+ transporter CorA
MDIQAFVLSDNSRLKPIPSKDRSPEWLKDEFPCWIDVDAPDANKLGEFLVPLGIPQSIIESCLKPSDEPELERYEDMIYIEFPIISKKHEFQRTYVSIIFLPTTLVTIHMEKILGISFQNFFGQRQRRYITSHA